MNLEIDLDVKAVAEFMQGNIPPARLVAVAQALGSAAPILWGRYQPKITSEISSPAATESE